MWYNVGMTEEKVTPETKQVTQTEVEHPDSSHSTCHHKHGWLSKHFCTRNLKKFGALGVILFVLHILFHVVEILLIPTILVWLGWK